MKTAIPGEIVDPRGGFEEHDWRALGRRRLADNAFCSTRNLEIIQPADKTAFEALSEYFVEHKTVCPPILSAIFPPNRLKHSLRYVQLLPYGQG